MALRRIALRDFVIVRALELDLGTGFSVLTGETGAGKSILIDALQLALGSRADAGAVREGAERLDVSAEFDPVPALAAWLDEGGFAAGDSLLLRRTVDTQGRSRGWINGSPATAAQIGPRTGSGSCWCTEASLTASTSSSQAGERPTARATSQVCTVSSFT